MIGQKYMIWPVLPTTETSALPIVWEKVLQKIDGQLFHFETQLTLVVAHMISRVLGAVHQNCWEWIPGVLQIPGIQFHSNLLSLINPVGQSAFPIPADTTCLWLNFYFALTLMRRLVFSLLFSSVSKGKTSAQGIFLFVVKIFIKY